MGQHSGHYHRFARMLRAEGFETWAMDTAGHGLSEGDPRQPGTLTELANDATLLVRTVRAEHAATPLVLVGHSLGAATALGVLGVATPDESADAHSATYQDHPSAPSVAAGMLSGLALSGTPKRVLGAARPNGARTPLPPSLPVLALHGVDDRMTPVEPVRVWTRRHESVSLREYIGAGHDLWHEPVHARVSVDIVEWMRDVVVGSARQTASGAEHVS
ncbi:hypothetical protein GCM10023318_01370 [Nocardia callitridis]|uniref:Serine aminopeptidase S33 domain-containing protein n=2 Tax=Nocardia callitridis TaxID=648753 RepID=A0ABP9JRA6_9NOCA